MLYPAPHGPGQVTAPAAVQVSHLRVAPDVLHRDLPQTRRDALLGIDALVETIVGLKRDEVFGPVVMFGIGGIFVEVYQDVTFRLCPVGEKEVEDMLSEVKGYKLLGGFRGKPKAGMDALKKVILAVCALGTENPEVGSVDLNPVLVNGEGALALDTRIVLQ